jgi:hypothetical protein
MRITNSQLSLRLDGKTVDIAGAIAIFGKDQKFFISDLSRIAARLLLTAAPRQRIPAHART